MNTEPVTRKEKYLAKIRGEDVQIPKEPYTREEKYLNAIATMISDKICTKEEFDKKIAEVESKIGETFTADEKEKLKSLTNPVTVKGTCNSLEELEQKDAKVGDMWFVKGEAEGEKSKEYVRTEAGTWDLVGDNSIDLTNYVKDTDFASADKAGIIKNVGANKSGIDIDEQGNISIAHPDNVSELDTSSQKHTALTLDRVQPVMAYYGLSNQNTLENDYVKHNDTPSKDTSGPVKIDFSNDGAGSGFGIDNNGLLTIHSCPVTSLDNEQNSRYALHPNNIPMFMKNYGLESKTYLKDTYQRKDEHASTTQYGNIMLSGEYAGLVLSSDGKLGLAGVTTTEINKETSSVRKALVPMSIPVFMNNYGITNKGWCHEIKKKVESSRTTNENGICVTQNCIVLVAGCSNVVDGVSVTVVPFLNKDNLNNTSLIFKNTKTDEPLKSTEITNLTYYYIEPFDEVTDPQSDEPSISEQPSFYEQDISPNSIEPKPQSTTNVQTKSFSKSETPVTPQSTKTFTTSTT